MNDHSNGTGAPPSRFGHHRLAKTRQAFSEVAAADAEARRIARKSAALANARARGLTSHERIADFLGVSKSYVQKCLAADQRAELRDIYYAALGVQVAA